VTTGTSPGSRRSEAREAAALDCGDAAGDRLGHDAARLDAEAGRRDLPELVVGGLAGVDTRHGQIHPKRMPETCLAYGRLNG
jgi:hypothetical protein